MGGLSFFIANNNDVRCFATSAHACSLYKNAGQMLLYFCAVAMGQRSPLNPL